MQHRLYHIAAVSGDFMAGQGIIGKENQLPWPKFPEDLKFFKATTSGGTVIMGRKTFESIGGKALPNRENIVLSRSHFKVPEGVQVFHSLEGAIKNASSANIFIIGGGELYRETIYDVDGIYLTEIKTPYPGDVKYPPIPPSFVRNEQKTKELQEKYKIPVIYFEKIRRPTNIET